MPDNISIEVIGLEDLMNRIKMLPTETQKLILDDVGEYSRKTLAELQAKYKYVSRKQAYGVSFFSAKQRAYVMAAIRRGDITIPYRRTGTLAGGWRVQRGSKDYATITNNVPYAPYVQGIMQSRHEKLVGWKRVVDIIAGELSFRSSKFRAVTMAAYQKAIRKLRLG